MQSLIFDSMQLLERREKQVRKKNVARKFAALKKLEDNFLENKSEYNFESNSV